MKELLSAVIEKVKEAEKEIVLLWSGIMGIVIIVATSIVIIRFFKMIVSIVQLVTAANPGTPSY
jgi:hypothetical protein